MCRFSLVLLTGLLSAGLAPAAPWAESLFAETNHDFGSVPRGPTLSHAFRLTNRSSVPLHISSVRVSCGCVSASAVKEHVAPGESTVIQAYMDTRRFSGPKAVTIYVQFDQPQWDEARLWVQANGRDDLMVTPETLSFGQTKKGTAAEAAVTISLYGGGQVVSATAESNYVKPTIEAVRGQNGETSYRLVAKLRPDTPVGRWYTDVVVSTNNPSMPRLRVPLTVEVEPVLTVSQTMVSLGEVKVGKEAEMRVVVKGSKPFKIKEVTGTNEALTVKDMNPDSRPVHILTIKLQSDKPGEINRTIKVITDLPEEGQIEFQARANVVK